MANCETCKGKESKIEETFEIKMPKYALDLWDASNQRARKNLIIALVLSIVLMFASNLGWLIAWCSYDYSSEEIIVEQDAQDGGNANYIGNDGDIVNGLPESDTQETDENP